MKRILIPLALIATALTACHKSASTDVTAVNQDSLLLAASQQELREAVAERDQLLELINSTINDMNDLRATEKIIAINNNGEGDVSTANALASNLAAIRASLKERQQRISALEKQLRESKTAGAELLATLEALRTQVADQTAQIDALTRQLNDAHQHIAQLDQDLAEANEQTQVAQEEALRQENLANACYYCIGSKDELKAHGIIEGGGFLRKSKIMQGQFDKSFFEQADKRALTELPLHSNKAKVLTAYQPKGSYEIVDINGQKVLRILNPAEFWSVSNYLVIQID